MLFLIATPGNSYVAKVASLHVTKHEITAIARLMCTFKTLNFNNLVPVQLIMKIATSAAKNLEL